MMAGEWNVETTMMMAPGAPEQTAGLIEIAVESAGQVCIGTIALKFALASRYSDKKVLISELAVLE
jgi:hypothetical protein